MSGAGCGACRVPRVGTRARAACRVSAHDPCERLSRCVIVVPVYTWEPVYVLDESLKQEMRTLDGWKSSDCNRQKMEKRQKTRWVCQGLAGPVCKPTQPALAAEQAQEVKDAELTRPVLAEPTQPALAAEQAREVKDAEPTQPVLAEPVFSQFSPPTPVSPFPPVPPHPSVSPSFAISPSPHSPVQSVSPMGGFLFCSTASPTAP